MRILLVTLFSLFLLFSEAMAETARFTVSGTDFTVSVPEGWIWETISDGLQITRHDKQASIALSLFPNPEKVNLASFLQSVLSSVNLTDSKKVEKKNSVTITGHKQNIAYTIVLTDRGDSMLACVGSGSEKKIIDAFVATLKEEPKKSE